MSFDQWNNMADVADPRAVFAAQQQLAAAQRQAQSTAKPQAKGNFFTHLLPSIGGIGGAIGGAALGTALLPGIGTASGGLLGALLGGAGGGAAGKVGENAIEHQGLGNGVKGAAIENGILSAGPIRLAKGLGTGLKVLSGIGENAVAKDIAAQGGSKLAQALSAGGASAMAPSAFKTAISNKLSAFSDNQAAKSLGITKGQKNLILQKTGERAGSIASRNNVWSPEDVKAATQPLYDEFNSVVNNIPHQFTPGDVHSAFSSIYEPMLAEGQPLGIQKMGQALKAEADNLVAGLKGAVSPAELNSRRQAFDQLAYKLKASDPGAADVNKQARDILAGMVRDAADKTGTVGESGRSLTELGTEINKLERLGTAAGKNVEGAGGHMQLGFGSVPGAVIGSGGGPVGAAAGYAANMALNSSAGAKAASKLGDKLAGKILTSAQKNADNAFKATGIAKRVAPVGLAGALLGAQNNQDSSNAPMNQQTATSNTMPTTSIDPLSQLSANNASLTTPQQQTPQDDPNSPLNPANVEAGIQAILANGGKMSDVTSYVNLVKTMQSLSPTTNKQLNSTQQQQSFNAQSGLTSLNDIANALQKNPNEAKLAALPGGGLTASLTGTGSYKAAIANATDVIGRLRSGGAIGQEEEKQFKSLLPQTFDTPQTAQYKLNQLATLFQQFANPQAAAADPTTSLLSSLGAQ